MRVGIGILGFGTVGGALLTKLINEHASISTKTGLEIAVVKVAVRDTAKARSVSLSPGVLTNDPWEVVNDPGVQLVVEIMGGEDPAGDLVAEALRLGKPVVTANKALIAARGKELIAIAEESGVPLLFEAAVAGGIPIIRPLSETLAGEQIDRVLGIVNGTTNYILTQMTENGAEYKAALAEAQELGYAEADPTADVSGADAAAKAAILASLAFGTWVGFERVYTEGIDGIDATDVRIAAELGYVIKLLAVAENTAEGISVRVHPTFVPGDHPLAVIRGATNAVFVEGPSFGELLFAGPGAGGAPTGTAVLGDVVDAARELLAGAEVAPPIRFQPGRLFDFTSVKTTWYLRLEVADRPGVLAQVAGVFGDNDVSIKSVWQEGEDDGATLLLVTHAHEEGRHRASLDELRALDVVRNVGAVIRVEGTGPTPNL
ncbi:MAG: homoserine dehydrogenase [Acidimicrobiia bacterium]|nr:homoserine dehydrogenase [Acidimicrobiia bacterium]NNF09447.1 homoserine dehydrogenase [Acidimicrobiia bacterium]